MNIQQWPLLIESNIWLFKFNHVLLLGLYSQQDSQELLTYLLEGLHEDVNRVTIKKKRMILDDDDDDGKR